MNGEAILTRRPLPRGVNGFVSVGWLCVKCGQMWYGNTVPVSGHRPGLRATEGDAFAPDCHVRGEALVPIFRAKLR